MASASPLTPTDPLGSTVPAIADLLADTTRIDGFGTRPEPTLRWVVRAGGVAPLPGDDTAALWQLLVGTARLDVAAARMLEPHLDALAILAQARDAGVIDDLPFGTTSGWGVFAAEGGDDPVRAEREADGSWHLTGTKPWCSLAAHLGHALVTARVGDERGLFAVDLRRSDVTAHSGPWHARGLSQVTSAPVGFAATPAVAVGDPGWYLRRPGFAWGGMGVAAVWRGAMAPIADAIAARAGRADADQLAAVYAGRADAAGWAASLVLADASRAVDAKIEGDAAKLLAARVRAVVAGAARELLALEARALGPGPVTTDEDHARRVADLDLYLRQDHGDRDLARLGRRSTEVRR